MGIKVKEQTIDDKKIMVTQFGGRRSVKINTKLIRMVTGIIGPVLPALSSIKDENSISDIDIDIVSLSKSLVNQLDEDKTYNLIRELTSQTRIDNRELDDQLFDDIFAGNLSLLYKIIAFVIKVNWGDFLALGSIGKMLGRKTEPILQK